MTFTKIYEGHDEGEISIIKSLLDANEITFVVENENFGSLYPGGSIPFNARNIFVPEEDVDRVRILLSRLHETPRDNIAG
ncbi:MAG: DUF2007 domain-containing protein [Nitrospirales bacterium]|nr:DUF2007 domain-containing protein [Nitrospirales bacterium]